MKKKFIALSVIASSFFCSGQNIALIEPKEEDDDSKCKVTLSCWPGSFIENTLDGPYGSISCSGHDCKRNQTYGSGSWVECDGVKAECV